MPNIELSKKALHAIIGRRVADDVLRERISMLGCDLDAIEGDAIKVEIFPNRPDLLSQEGFGLALAAFLDAKGGLTTIPIKDSHTHCTVKDPLKIWPYAVTAIARGLSLEEEKVRDLIQLQEKLGVTMLRNRAKGGIGIYPLDRITPPITFTTMEPERIRFRPLEYPHELTGRQILTKHPTGRAYAHIIAEQRRFPVFIDAKGVIMSMPPIINSHDVGKIDATTRELFIEATGPDLLTLERALRIIAMTLSQMGAQVESMQVRYANRRITTPDMTPQRMRLDLEAARRLLGIPLTKQEAKRCLARMGCDLKGDEAIIPAYRADILHHVDLIDEIAIGHGYERIDEEIPRVATVGEEDAMERFISRLRAVLIGFGLLEVRNYNLSSTQTQTTRCRIKQAPVPLKNAMTREYDVLRSAVMPSLLETLERNRHHEYPQELFEIGTAFSKEAKAPTRVAERERLAIALCSDHADYTGVRQLCDAIARALNLTFTYAEHDHPSCIEGRAAIAKVGSARIATLGETHPEVLERFGLTMPVAWCEVELDTLLRALRAETDF